MKERPFMYETRPRKETEKRDLHTRIPVCEGETVRLKRGNSKRDL